MTQKATILVVEDEPAIQRLIQYNLEAAGHKVILAGDGANALDMLEDNNPDLLVLDWMLPEVSGIEICEYIRDSEKHRKIPIILLTARGEEEDRLQGLDAGADDYIVKPFSPKELVARISAVLRRTRPSLSEEVIACEKLKADVSRGELIFLNDGAEIKVKCGPTEFRLACFMMERPGQVFSREALLDGVWKEKDLGYDSRTIDVHIRRLRQALDKAFNGAGEIVETIRNHGYSIKK